MCMLGSIVILQNMRTQSITLDHELWKYVLFIDHIVALNFPDYTRLFHSILTCKIGFLQMLIYNLGIRTENSNKFPCMLFFGLKMIIFAMICWLDKSFFPQSRNKMMICICSMFGMFIVIFYIYHCILSLAEMYRMTSHLAETDGLGK